MAKGIITQRGLGDFFLYEKCKCRNGTAKSYLNSLQGKMGPRTQADSVFQYFI